MQKLIFREGKRTISKSKHSPIGNTDNMEVWKTIPGFSKYKVSDYGNVNNGKINLKGTQTEKGYLVVTIQNDLGVTKRKKIHRLVLLAFIGHSDLEIDHKDTIKTNNAINNLEYVTTKENVSRRFSKYESQYQGISWDKEKGKFRLRLLVDGKRKSFGRFRTKEEARQHLCKLKAL